MSWNDDIIDEFRANEGRVGGVFEGKPLLLLHHVGARTGEKRVSPLMYQPVDDGYAVFASRGGSHQNPGWYHNLKSNPSTTVEVGTERFPVRAREIHGEEYEQIWSKQKEDHPQFAAYERKTSRDRIPVFVLEKV
ncbi:MAG: nitroreductase family deazaflavin-dependent oxidoreductase [Acidimicrobiia bacterium]|nr:nitroreductase family deazaflavin-dependent oxidoreductase [Acidimicrobiia bacterium]